MSQTYTDDCFSPSNVAQTDMGNIENNFAALKSAFSGSSAPSNTVQGMWWFDTSANILKVRNVANSAWLSVWDLSNNKPVITNLSAEITLAMIAASATDPSAATGGLRTLGTGAAQACAGNDSRLSDARTPTNSSVAQAKLKTTTGTASVYNNIVGVTGALPGGQYGFRLQVSSSGTTADFEGLWYENLNSTYVSPGCRFTMDSSYQTCYARERYVQSSGEVFWIFYLKNRETGIIEKEWQAPDHCCFGNGDDPELFQHPYGDYDQDKYELIVVNPPLDIVKEMKSNTHKHGELLETIKRDWAIDELSEPPWPTKAVTVGLPDDWEDLWDQARAGYNVDIKTIKSTIPRPRQAVTKVLKRKNI